MRVLGMDLSKSATGWATWAPGDAKPVSGWRQLGSEFTPRGLVFAKLHELMSEIAAVCGAIDALFIEDALTPETLHGHTNIETTKILLGLSAHALSWAEATGVRVVREVHQKTWRREFLGSIPPKSQTKDLKQMATDRARSIGVRPGKHDEAEAVGVMDYGCTYLGLSPPWRAQLTLVPQFGRRVR